jgi:hypothetical protein
MCTSIVEAVSACGSGKGVDGWFDLTHLVVSYDQPHHALLEEAITIDFVNSELGPWARVAVELTLEAAKELRSRCSGGRCQPPPLVQEDPLPWRSEVSR